MKYATLIICLAFSFGMKAQKTYDDAQLRFNLGLEKRITKKLSITLDQQDRWTKNISQFNRASLDLGISYKITKYLRIKGDYVFIQKRNNQAYFTPRNWYYLAAIFKAEKGQFKFFFREMAQARMGNRNDDEYYITRYYSRSKITIRHETTRRYAFWIAGEVYVPLNSPRTKGVERSRGTLGYTLRTFKDQSLDLYFMYQHFHQRNKWFDQDYRYQNEFLRRDFIYGINYNIAF